MINILITGGSGFLGSSIINHLSKKKKIRFFYLIRNKSNLTRINKYKKNVKILYNDKNIERLFLKKKINLIIHCATNYGKDDRDITNIVQSNLVLPLRLLFLAKKYGVKAFINTDTILEKNISFYTLSKFQFNEWFEAYSNHLYCCNVKIEHFFGPKDNFTKFVIYLIVNILQKKKIKLTKGDQKRDFIFIDDVVNAFEKIIEHSLKKKKGKDTFEIGTGKSISIKKIALLILEITKSNKNLLKFGAIPYRKNEPMNIKINLKKIKSIGWKPMHNIKESLEKTISYYK